MSKVAHQKLRECLMVSRRWCCYFFTAPCSLLASRWAFSFDLHSACGGENKEQWTLAASVQGGRKLALSQRDANFLFICSSALKTSNSRCLDTNILWQYSMAERCEQSPAVTIESGSLTLFFIPPPVPLSLLLLLWHPPSVCLSSPIETWNESYCFRHS